MLKTRARFLQKDESMSQCVDLAGHTKAITNPLALGLLIGLKNNKCIPDSDSVRSPKSPLEFRVLSTMAEPLFFLRSSLTCCGPAKVGLSIVGDDRSLSPDVVFGPALRITHPKSLKIEKETTSGVTFQIGSEETDPINRSFSANDCLRKTRLLSRSNLGASEDDMEDYTCVIAHGPNPRTTHIYGGRVLECHQNDNKEMHMFDSEYFLSVCNFCNKKLQLGEDIYMYRGEKAFCSEECRSEEMMMDEEYLEDSSIPPVHDEFLKMFF